MGGHVGQSMTRRGWAVVAAIGCVLVLPACQPQQPPPGPVIAYPNLRVQVPTNEISISSPSANQRTLDFTHITWNAGDGPLEIDPHFDPATGQATATQALSTLTGPTTWSVVKSVPIVKPMTWDPPSDYRFPLTGFGLYSNTAAGGVGTLLTTSPKVDFCMTPDTFVGGVPNTTATGIPSPDDCDDPNGVLGLSVGWGDLYDHEDAGNNIDISNLPDGTYWLRAQADPGNYFAQSGPNQTVTDTQLQIKGTTVTVLQQVTPTPTRPVVVVTAPKDGASITGTTTVQAVAADSATITSVQFLVDGAPLGAPQTPTSPPTPYQTTLSGLSPGPHVLSAQATDANGFVGTAPGVTVNVPITVGSIVIDRDVNATGSGHVTATVDTSAANETLLALVGSDDAGPGETTTVSGGGLTWSPVQRVNTQRGDSEIWSASVPSATTGIGVAVDSAQPNEGMSLTVLALQNAALGASTSTSGASGAPTVSFTATAAGSIGVGVGNDFDHAADRTVGANQAIASQWLDNGTGDTYWSQYSKVATTSVGQKVTLNDTAPTNDRWNFAAVELRPTGPPAAAAPAVDEAPAPPGAVTVDDPNPPLAITVDPPTNDQPVSGTIDVSATVADAVPVTSVQFTLDGLPLGAARTTAPYTTSWNTVTALPGVHTLAATATDAAGRSAVATDVPVTVATQSVCFVKDVNTSAHGQGTITTAPFHTGIPDELLLAFVTADGPPGGGQQTTVDGAGLTWRLVKRSAAGQGTAEIWSATTMSVLTAAQVTATPALPGFDTGVQVVALQGTGGLGATAAASGTSGPPTVGLTTTKPQSLVFAVGSSTGDPARATPGSNQVIDGQWAGTADPGSSWTQNTSVQTGPTGSPITIDDTSPTTSPWNLVAVEVVAADNAAYTD
jgi:hypothetical protein